MLPVIWCWQVLYIQLLPLKVLLSFDIVMPKRLHHFPSETCCLMRSDNCLCSHPNPSLIIWLSRFRTSVMLHLEFFVLWRYQSAHLAYLMCNSIGLLLYHNSHTVCTICLEHYNSLGQWDAMDSNHPQFIYRLAHMFEYILGVVLNIYVLIAAIKCHLLDVP